MNAVVTNVHHFSHGVTLTIEDGKSMWSLDSSHYLFNKMSKSSESLKEPSSLPERITLDQKNSIDDFIQLISLAYMFVGTLASEKIGTISNDIKIEDNDNLTQWDIVNHIYNTPLEYKIKLIRYSQCGCNMGHCWALTGVDVDDKDFTTYGDVISTFARGKVTSEDGKEIYWIYPDSVFLFTTRIYELPKQVHSKGSCYSKKVNLNLDLEFEQDVIYLSWGYGR